MKSTSSEAAMHRVFTAALAKLMQLPPPGTGSGFTVASASLDESDPAFEQVMLSAKASQFDMLIAIVERRADGTKANRLMLIETTGNVTRALDVDLACIATGEPAILVSASRHEAWQYRSGRLHRIEVPEAGVLARGIGAAVAKIADLLTSAAPLVAQLRVRKLTPYREQSATC